MTDLSKLVRFEMRTLATGESALLISLQPNRAAACLANAEAICEAANDFAGDRHRPIIVLVQGELTANDAAELCRQLTIVPVVAWARNSENPFTVLVGGGFWRPVGTEVRLRPTPTSAKGN